MVVPGNGSHNSKIMFIGEAPGSIENETGLPFSGKSGTLLDNLLQQIGLVRQDVFITNLVKCRPPMNRNPSAKEIKSCLNFLLSQITILKPTLIVTLGNVPLSALLPKESISKSHGKLKHWKGVDLLPFYHPAAALYNPKLKPVLKKDFDTLSQIIKKSMTNI